MLKSNFEDDLSNEVLLGKYLDSYYEQIFRDSSYSTKRIGDIGLQHRGVDVVLSTPNSIFYVDEKAQLDYLNHALPTFAFELSYLKNGSWTKGWLFDKNKLTDIYFLITNIHTIHKNDLSKGLSKLKITGVYRNKLIDLLKKKGLNETRLYELEKEFRARNKHGKIPVNELDPKREGAFYFSKTNKNEQPMNLVLKLKFLIDNQAGKSIFSL